MRIAKVAIDFAWVFVAAIALFSQATVGHAQTRTELGTADALYPRVIRLAHQTDPAKNGLIIASVTTFTGGTGHEDIYSSTSGTGFAKIGTVADSPFSKGLCCGTLVELPSAVGSLSAGTLLWAGSVGGDTPAAPMEIRVYKSGDQGVTWSYLSNCATGSVPKSQGGLWEPEFAIAKNGRLVCYYSDETESGHSQVLNEVSTADGLTWTGKTSVISSAVAADRPGMMVVSELPNGSYFMTHELCGPAACTVFYKTSADGLNWGSPTDVGKRVQTAAGQYFLHTPTNAWAPLAGSPNGQIVLIGQILIQSNGSADPGNGQTMFVNTSSDGSGPWTTLAAPVKIVNPLTPSNPYNSCQNYSSPLLPSPDGKTVLEFASDFVGAGCHSFFATGALVSTPGIGVSAISVATTGTNEGTSTITLTSTNGYAGTVVLSVSIAGLAADTTFNPASVTLAANGSGTSVLSIKPLATAMLSPEKVGLAGFGFAGILFAGAIGPRRRKRTVGIVTLAALALVSGCGDGSSGGASTPTPPAPVTTTYSGTVTARDSADGTIVATAPITVTVTR